MIALRNLTLFNSVDKLNLFQNVHNAIVLNLYKNYASKSTSKPLTDAQIQSQKYATEMQFKKKTSLRGTDFQINDVDTSIEYVNSEAYNVAYGDDPVWKKYVRNYGGHVKPQWTRRTCIRGGRYASGNPCPICRDEFLIVHVRNLKLLKQFVSETTGMLLPVTITNVCQMQNFNLQVAYRQAIDRGLIEYYVPHRHYDYSLYYSKFEKLVTTPSLLLNVVTAAKQKNTNKLLDDLTYEEVMSVHEKKNSNKLVNNLTFDDLKNVHNEK